MNQHRLLVARNVVQEDLRVAAADINYSLFYQMTRICRERGALKHDDRLDAKAICVAYWVSVMDRDESMALKQHAQRMFDKELEVFFENLVEGGQVYNPDQFVSFR